MKYEVKAAEDSEPLASFQFKEWAEEWRNKMCATGLVREQIKHDLRPKRLSWAPGGYLKTCPKCDGKFSGDKRALLCADCAYALPDPNSEASLTRKG